MYQPDDKYIEHVSRQAAAHYQPPGQPSWEALSKLLDKALPQEKEKKRRGFLFFIFLALGLSLAGSIIWLGAGRSSLPADPSRYRQASHTPAAGKTHTAVLARTALPDANGLPAGKAPAYQAGVEKKQATPAGNYRINPEKSYRQQSNANKTSMVLVPVMPEKPLKAIFTANARDRKTPRRLADPLFIDQPAKQGRKKNGFHIDKLSAAPKKSPVAIKSNRHPAESHAEETAPLAMASGAAEAAYESIAADSASHLPQAIPGIPVPATAPASSDSAAQKAAAPVKTIQLHTAALLIGLTAGLDMSTVKFTYGSAAGYNIGITAGYRFSRHLSAYTGVIYTKKNYKLNGTDYHPPRHYWTQYVQLETVDGYCLMWEIPFAARYAFAPGHATSFFAGAGLSSYFMKKQQYEYYYKNYGGSNHTTWTNDSTFKHLFSVLDLSVGMEKKINRHLSWLIEPYARIPLGGIGFGNIRLSSFGLNLTLQYRQPLRH